MILAAGTASGKTEAAFLPSIAEKIAEILCSDETYPYLDEAAMATLQDQRQVYHRLLLTPDQRLIRRMEKETVIHLFAGTKIANTLIWMLRFLGYSASRGPLSSVKLKGWEGNNFSELLHQILNTRWVETELFPFTGSERMWTKYSSYLPKHLQDLLQISGQMVIDETLDFLREVRWKELVVKG